MPAAVNKGQRPDPLTPFAGSVSALIDNGGAVVRGPYSCPKSVVKLVTFPGRGATQEPLGAFPTSAWNWLVVISFHLQNLTFTETARSKNDHRPSYPINSQKPSISIFRKSRSNPQIQNSNSSAIIAGIHSHQPKKYVEFNNIVNHESSRYHI
ncbi:hypothetical protein CEXT_288131 [Caerostris extrusa]|uniref:Uncharacterized protein n=1 Tax=Caerostris extrusa TaxID=172846 RepID=A0AAV4XZY8_CAEEX|nr:hypothetical protein CEXT_288131 [Caerostris extrusa]